MYCSVLYCSVMLCKEDRCRLCETVSRALPPVASSSAEVPSWRGLGAGVGQSEARRVAHKAEADASAGACTHVAPPRVLQRDRLGSWRPGWRAGLGKPHHTKHKAHASFMGALMLS